MPADNTIAILCTKGQNGNEYRVAHVQAIENLWFQPDYPAATNQAFSREYALRLFGKVPVFRSLDDAFEEARIKERNIGYVEYGIRLLNYVDIFFPASDEKLMQRARWRHGRRHSPSPAPM